MNDSIILNDLESVLNNLPNSPLECKNLLLSNEAVQEVTFLEIIHFYYFKRNSKGNVILTLRNEKDFSLWKRLIEHNLPFLNIEIRTLPSLSFKLREKYNGLIHAANERMMALSSLSNSESFTVLLATPLSLCQRTIDLETIETQAINISVGDLVDLDTLEKSVRSLGYQWCDSIDELGHYSRRGGIFDIFGFCYDKPVRIELLGDRVCSIRFFDPNTQVSIGESQEVKLGLAQEAELSECDVKDRLQIIHDLFLGSKMFDAHEKKSILSCIKKLLKPPGIESYYPLFRKSCKNQSLYFHLNNDLFLLQMSRENCETIISDFKKNNHEDSSQEIDDSSQLLSDDEYFDFDFDLNKLNSMFETSGLMYDGCKVKIKSMPSSNDEQVFIRNLKRYMKEGFSIAITCQSSAQIQRMKSLISSYDINCEVYDDYLISFFVKRSFFSKVCIIYGDIQSDLIFENIGLVAMPVYSVLKMNRRLSPSKKRNIREKFHLELRNLGPDTLVIHEDHGVGLYLGLESLDVLGVLNDFLVVEYAHKDRIYVPIDKIHKLKRYSGKKDGFTLDVLRGSSWKKRKSSVRRSIQDMAEELIKNHAQREVYKREAYSLLSDLYYELESDFPYEETIDQQKCIDDVNDDLSSQKPMDRLICGDVGFGKTEVAIRAAMRVVIDGFQVMVLVPTTILSMQHYQTFNRRMNKFGVVVGVLNRFVSKSDSQKCLQDFSKGTIDILIGTHRLLSSDIVPRKLGFIIVDEEQRFGVSHKEKLKKFKASCDILTLSATPIPRSLHMSLIGMKDISLIRTPPVNRHPIKTYILDWDEKIIREGVLKEVRRGGQVFFVHNRVSQLGEVKVRIEKLIPEIRVQVAHGQMGTGELERIVLDFIERKFDLLLCTTIIESGIDMPLVNTIFINNADGFGLSQLYQIRGRVGRTTRQSYAYFLVNSIANLSSMARQRLEVIAAHQELGMGFEIANHDLEMRGGGDILGGSQSGHIEEVGIDLYTEMLENEVRRLKGIPIEEEYDCEIQISLEARIPDTYIHEEVQRLSLYKRLFSCTDIHFLESIKSEIEDRYGNIPGSVENLIKIAELKLCLKELNVRHLSEIDQGFTLRFGSLSEVSISKLQKVSGENAGFFRINEDYSATVLMEKNFVNPFEKIKKLISLLRVIIRF